MRIALVHSYDLNGSGSSIYVWNLSKALAQQGHEVVVFRYRTAENSIREQELSQLGVELAELPMWAVTVTYARPEFKGAKHILDLNDESIQERVALFHELLQRSHEKKPIELVVANHFLVGAFAVVSWAVRHNVRSVAISHGTDIEYVAAREPNWAARSRHVVLAADCNVVLNERARARVSDVLGVSSDRLKVVPPGIDLKVFQYESTARRSSIALVGRLILDKGQHLLISSLPFMLDGNSDVEVLLIGDGAGKRDMKRLVDVMESGDAQALMRLAQGDEERRARFAPVLKELLSTEGRATWMRHRRKIRARVRFTGSLLPTQVADELLRCKLAVLPSMIQECYPLSLMEALACGCRVAGTSLAIPPSLWKLTGSEEEEASRSTLFDPLPSSLARAALTQLRAWKPGLAQKVSADIRKCMSWSRVGSSVLAQKEADNDSWDTNGRRESSWQRRGPTRLSAEG